MNTAKKYLLFTLQCAPLLAMSTMIHAHHSFNAQYDANQPVNLRGYVTKVEWYNPHVYFYIDVEDPETGEISNWGLEMGPPHMLQERGWKRNTLNIGDELEVEATRARDGSTTANVRTVILSSTGEVLGSASSELGLGNQQPRRTEEAGQ